jgi:hypothetical protein
MVISADHHPCHQEDEDAGIGDLPRDAADGALASNFERATASSVRRCRAGG